MNNKSGQAVLIILLTMVVALTVVLSIIAATTSDIKLSATESSSLRAFSAAESGVEKALLSNSSSNGSINNATFNSNIGSLAQGAGNFNYPVDLVSGDSGVFWFVSHASNGTFVCDASHPCFTGNLIKVCWGKPGTSSTSATTPAIEISAFYLSTPGNYTTSKVVKAVYDPNGTRRSLNSYDAIDSGSCTINNISYAFQKQFDLGALGIPAGSYGTVNGLQFMPVKMLYNTDVAHPMAMDVNLGTDSNLPSQGNLIDSTGSLNQSTRKVEVTRAYNQAPPPFDAAVFSPGGLTQ